VPARVRRSWAWTKSNSTVRRAGVPFLASFSPSAFSLPLMDSRPPVEVPLACSEAVPAMPGAVPASAEARFNFVTSSVTDSGVNSISVASIGPAFPSSLMSPPPASPALNENGNAAAGVKSRTSRFTLSRTSGLWRLPALPIEKRPSTILMSRALRSTLPAAAGSRAGAAGFVAAPPRLE